MKKVLSRIDKPLLIVMIILSAIGLLMVFSSSSVAAILRYNEGPTHFFVRQLMFFGMAYIGGVILLGIDTRVYKFFSWFLILGIMGLLAALLVYGTITNHAVSWFYIGSFGLQPSEFAKSFLIIFMGCFYGGLRSKKDNVKPGLYLIPISIAIILALLIMKQPDFGSAMILLAITFCSFISVPMYKPNISKIIMFIGIGVVIAGVLFLYSGSSILSSEQLSRFNFQNPCQRYKEDTGYQVCNGFIAINNGGLWGVGVGNSTQKFLYLPESHTDFIFAILIEELGLVAGIVVLFLYMILLFRLLKIAKEATNLRNSIIAYGVFWFFVFHIVINLCGMLALLPLTGVPLPLMSYGGSSTLNFVAMLFISLRISYENKDVYIKIKKVK